MAGPRGAYLVQKNSANERRHVSVLVFTALDNNRFENEDFEKLVASFRYFSGKSAGTPTVCRDTPVKTLREMPYPVKQVPGVQMQGTAPQQTGGILMVRAGIFQKRIRAGVHQAAHVLLDRCTT